MDLLPAKDLLVLDFSFYFQEEECCVEFKIFSKEV